MVPLTVFRIKEICLTHPVFSLDIYYHSFTYSTPSLIRPPYLATNCGYIREVAFGEVKVDTFIVVAAKSYDHIRGATKRDHCIAFVLNVKLKK